MFCQFRMEKEIEKFKLDIGEPTNSLPLNTIIFYRAALEAAETHYANIAIFGRARLNLLLLCRRRRQIAISGRLQYQILGRIHLPIHEYAGEG